MISKSNFLKYMNFIEDRIQAEIEFCKVLDKLSPSTFNDSYIYDDYESMLLEIICNQLKDTTELIEYKLYEFDSFSEEQKKQQLEKTPEVESWETVYDYLIANFKEDTTDNE